MRNHQPMIPHFRLLTQQKRTSNFMNTHLEKKCALIKKGISIQLCNLHTRVTLKVQYQ